MTFTPSQTSTTNQTSQPTPMAPASPWRRLAAMGYDSLLLMGLSLGYGGIAVALRQLIFGTTSEATQLPGPFFQLGWVVLLVGFFLFFWRRGGQTLGMRAWRIKVMNRDGSALRFGQGLIRCALAPLSLGLGGLGYWWCWIDRDGQTPHDKLSKSVTVLLPPTKK